MFSHLQHSCLQAEVPVVQVWKGAEDGRLLRVLVRLSSVLERPESETDPQWAETGVPHFDGAIPFWW